MLALRELEVEMKTKELKDLAKYEQKEEKEYENMMPKILVLETRNIIMILTKIMKSG